MKEIKNYFFFSAKAWGEKKENKQFYFELKEEKETEMTTELDNNNNLNF